MKWKQCRRYLMNTRFLTRIPELPPVRFWISGPGWFCFYLVCSVARPYSDGCISNPAKWRVQFQIFNCHYQGRPRAEPWRSWRDLILQRVPSVVTSPNGASPQSKHCNPMIPSHSRISQLVPPEYVGNLGRGKIGTQTRVIFASPCKIIRKMVIRIIRKMSVRCKTKNYTSVRSWSVKRLN